MLETALQLAQDGVKDNPVGGILLFINILLIACIIWLYKDNQGLRLKQDKIREDVHVQLLKLVEVNASTITENTHTIEVITQRIEQSTAVLNAFQGVLPLLSDRIGQMVERVVRIETTLIDTLKARARH